MITNFFCKKQISNIFKTPNKTSERVSQLLFGEDFVVLKNNKDFYYGYSAFDKYYGYVLKKNFQENNNKKKYRITKQKSFLFTGPTDNQITKKYILFNSLVPIIEKNNNFIKINKYWIKKNSINKINSNNFLKTLPFFFKTRYLWGGNSIKGIDCSGLVQELLKSINHKCPRDSKDQINFFKKKIALSKIKKGDLIFWTGHVAIALNKKNLVHAYGPKKKVIIMPIKKTIENLLLKNNLKILAIKRPIS